MKKEILKERSHEYNINKSLTVGVNSLDTRTDWLSVHSQHCTDVSAQTNSTEVVL